MKKLEILLKQKVKKTQLSRPELFKLNNPSQRGQVFGIIKNNPNIQVIDDYREQLKELFAIRNPNLALSPDFLKDFGVFLAKSILKTPMYQQGVWAYFPWLQTFSHILPEPDFFEVRTARNKLLITRQEQEKFYKTVVGIGGLSIGSSVALAVVLQGGAKHIRLADFDQLALSNTNRVRAGVQNLGMAKVEIAARQIYEVNPYAKVEIFNQGLTKENIKKFVTGLDIVVDEMDSLSVKFLLRQEARNHKIPLVMGADNGDMAVVDIERYDKNQKLKFFHGRLGKLTADQMNNMSKFEIGRTIAQLVGLENHTPRMLQSLQEMGKTVVSWPQLGGTAQLNGAAIAYCVRKICTNQPLVDNRAIISFDKHLDASYETKSSKLERLRAINKFKEIFKL